MKRSVVLLSSCLALAGTVWLAHVVWGQTAETKEKTITITKSQFDEYVAKAVAAERDKAAHDKAATDEQVLNPQNWHKAIFNQMEFVIYTGPGQVIPHHWVPVKGTAPRAPAAAPAPKGS